MKSLVTGSSGFLGSHVADILTEKGHKVVLFDTKPSKHKSANQDEFIGDILNMDDVEKAANGCDYIFHFAAQADIETSNLSPNSTIKSNIIGTLNLLEASRKNNIKRFVFASTVYVYSNLGGFYRVSKQSCEKIIEQYFEEFNIRYTIIRYGSLYGNRANKFNFISKALTQALKNKKIVRNGNGNEIREYIHVKDAAELTIKSLSDDYINKSIIITGNEQIKIKDLLIMIKEIFNDKIEIEFKGERQNLNHYIVTPYNYRSQIAKKITPSPHYDLGQGIIDLLHEIDQKLSTKK